MSLITLETTFTKNASLQVGDIIYYLDEGEDLIRKIGVVQQILDNGIVCDTDSASQLGPLSSTSYIFFGKDIHHEIGPDKNSMLFLNLLVDNHTPQKLEY